MISKRQLFLNHVAQTSDMPLALEIESGRGVQLFDTNGKAYIDLISGIGVSCLGHCHPAVVEAVKSQAERYMHTMVYGEFVLSPQVELATLLTSQLPERLNSVYFVNSGAEATEGALKLAKRCTGRQQIVACKLAYHGSTHGALSLMSDPYFSAPFRPLLPDIHFIEFNEEQHLDKITEETACVVMETVRAEIGVMTPKDDYLKKVRQRCDEVGALLIFDEIQAGYGRTGSLFAFQQYDAIPDVLLLAKGMGGGMPIGAFVADKNLMNQFSHDPVLGHITTFGGHPVTCAAALATLKTLLKNPEIISSVDKKAALIKDKLKHPSIRTIRSAGLLMAVELDDFDQVKRVINKGIELGLIIDWFLFNDKSIRIAPPLTITVDEINEACEKLLIALNEA